MRLGFGLNLEQTQKLIMTPELRQAITILQLSAMELSEYLQEQVLENPVLEIKEDSTENIKEDSSPQESENFDIDWQEYFQNESNFGYVRLPYVKAEESSVETNLSKGPTLHEHLMHQLYLAVPSGTKRLIGEFLIGNMDEYGYLDISIEEICRKLGKPKKKVEDVLRIIQEFDPPGVGARDLVECLLIQYRQKVEKMPYVEHMIKYHLEDLGAGRWRKIAREMKISTQEVQAVSEFMKLLDPKPGRQFGNLNETHYIVPDAVVEKVGDEFVVLVNDVSVPRLGINSAYRALLKKDQSCDEETRKFLEGRMDAAAWVIKSLEQRRMTLYRVILSIIDFQKEFFEKGVKFLKPLNLKQVANVIGMHESTVSRTTANKYVQTPQGVFELKFFFAGGVNNDFGPATATESIKKDLEEFISGEDPKKPYTDRQLTDYLNRRGINISRRTVAKYRSEMGVPSSHKRKRY